ncbi:MAG TPA: capsular polysaccharide biosynthesis protein [Burkholderiaceae bacterium]|nr:capsular polysaccharide biosynthesis protein [Burkholderiaceae bacterium]
MTPRAAAGSRCYVARTPGLMLVRGLQRFLDLPLVFQPFGRPRADAVAIVGWGLKGVAMKAKVAADRYDLPYLALEDGFLRSVAPGDADPGLSLAIDDIGIYYDAREPSRLEQQIAAGHDAAQRARAEALSTAWRAHRVSKYNHARERPTALPWLGRDPFVLVVDQTVGDASIHHGMADATSFARMLEAALDEHPHLPVMLKVHPDVIAGRKKAHFGRLGAGAASRVTLLAGNVHPPALFESARAVYVVTSQMGLEALIWGCPVRAFGMPFYAGWGLTQDELAPPLRRGATFGVTLPDLVHAALVDYPRYIDPETGERCEVERVLEWMGLQRRQRERFAPQVQAIAFSSWKRPIAQAFLGGSELRFVDAALPLGAQEQRATWGRPVDEGMLAQDAPGQLLRVEDGFLRSVGLGANFVRPLSWVIDRTGMYYDATRPSDLERLLEAGGFDAALLGRAAALRAAIVAAGVTKYNVGAGRWQRPPGDRTVILVPGQVESDASIAFGTAGVRSNLDLLRRVRERRPDAHVVYKPHPDIVAGRRKGAVALAEERAWCDEIVTDVPIHRLFEAVDEIELLTSLAGFEALLRGKPVTCHGSPFYAGWGLTTDLLPHPRRTRRLSLDELVAGALIVYPTYVSQTTGAFTTPERALYELAHWDETAPQSEPASVRALRLLKRLRKRLRAAR